MPSRLLRQKKHAREVFTPGIERTCRFPAGLEVPRDSDGRIGLAFSAAFQRGREAASKIKEPQIINEEVKKPPRQFPFAPKKTDINSGLVVDPAP